MSTIVPFPKPTLAQKIEAAFIRFKAPGLGEKLAAVVAWLNAKPGRKRGVAAAFGAASVILRVYGHTSAADYFTYANDVIQNYVTPGCDLVAITLAFVGWIHAHQEKRA